MILGQTGMSRRAFAALGLLCAPGGNAAGSFADFDRVEAMAHACRLALPAGANRANWTAWAAEHDRAIRARLRRGEEDSLVNFVLFGVSFTHQPRVTMENPDGALVNARVRDFLAGVRAPGNNERLAMLKELMGARGAPWVEENIARYLAEQRRYREVLDRAPAGDPIGARVYKDRGLSIDTNFRPNFGIERSLAALQQRGVLTKVSRVAVIGPGLDFTDKDRGFDYYPLQTLQPFALADSLLRLGLARAPELRVGVFDISSQTLDHVARAAGKPYTLQLVLDKTRPWKQDALDYWTRLGDQIGSAVEPLAAPPQVGDVARRAVRIRQEVVRALEPRQLNIVLERAEGGPYDLIVGTNVFVYYDAFEQSLAMLNIASMLTARGVFLSNTAMPECAGETLHSIGSAQVAYSGEPGDGDRIEMYSNAPLRRSLGPQ